jgi:hypothetical protein
VIVNDATPRFTSGAPGTTTKSNNDWPIRIEQLVVASLARRTFGSATAAVVVVAVVSEMVDLGFLDEAENGRTEENIDEPERDCAFKGITLPKRGFEKELEVMTVLVAVESQKSCGMQFSMVEVVAKLLNGVAKVLAIPLRSEATPTAVVLVLLLIERGELSVDEPKRSDSFDEVLMLLLKLMGDAMFVVVVALFDLMIS